jgi:hypothetical protein
MPSSISTASRRSPQRATHQLDQVLARARDELAADRRLRHRPGDLVDACADRLAGAGVAARGDAGEHPLQHDRGQLVSRGEVAVGDQLDLVLAVGGAGARPAHRHAPAAEGHLAVLVAVTHRGALRDVRALRADDLADLGLQQLVQHPESDAHAHRKQPVLRRADELAERVAHRRGQPSMPSWSAATGAAATVFMAVGPPVLVDFDSHSPRSQPDRTRREDRRLKFYGLRDNLPDVVPGGSRTSANDRRRSTGRFLGYGTARMFGVQSRANRTAGPPPLTPRYRPT